MIRAAWRKSLPTLLNLREKSQLLSGSEIERTLVRLAHEIVEKNNGVANLGLVGIMRRGVPLAAAVGEDSWDASRRPQVPVGTLDITLYRDDLSTVGTRPEVKQEQHGVRHSGQGHRPGRRCALHRPHGSRRAGRALRSWPPAPHSALRAHRSRPSRTCPSRRASSAGPSRPRTDEIIEVKLQETDGADKVLLMERIARRTMKPLGSLLSINQLTTEQIESILALARRMDPKRPSQLLRGKRVVLLFYEASTRTRTSFEFAAKALGAMTTLVTATVVQHREGRVADRYRLDGRVHRRRRHRHAASQQWLGAFAVALHVCAGGECRRRHAPASFAGAAGRADDSEPQETASRASAS